jgi:hypothetical protein
MDKRGPGMHYTSRCVTTIEQIEKAAGKRVLAAVQAVRTQAIKLLRNTPARTGKEYVVPGTGKYRRTKKGKQVRVAGTGVKYIASAPGEPPYPRTGNFREQVRQKVQHHPDAIVGRVGAVDKRGPWFEQGTKVKGRVRMKPRPWLRPAYENAKDKVQGIMSGKWF